MQRRLVGLKSEVKKCDVSTTDALHIICIHTYTCTYEQCWPHAFAPLFSCSMLVLLSHYLCPSSSTLVCARVCTGWVRCGVCVNVFAVHVTLPLKHLRTPIMLWSIAIDATLDIYSFVVEAITITTFFCVYTTYMHIILACTVSKSCVSMKIFSISISVGDRVRS